MAAGESWSKDLKCPVCGREGVARLSHLGGPSDPFEEKTVIEACPRGFEFREDEDDANIYRFYCIADQASADQ
jgi:hypothetical protein